jgi:uncharacterized protein involved in high-affinity Fe2+ transport
MGVWIRSALALGCTAFLAGAAGLANAAEYPIGKPQIAHGIEVGAVYLQPIEMDPPGMMREAKTSDIHLEADIHAVADNPNGFAEGEWVPGLLVHYTLARQGGKTIEGDMMPMVASDGPHYGDNVKLDGAGKYQVTFTVIPPSENKQSHFGRHVDKETGVGAWTPRFDLKYEFVYAGTGKKGGY